MRGAVADPVGGPVEIDGDLKEMINTRIKRLEAEDRKNFEIQSVQLQMSTAGDCQPLRTADLITYGYSDLTPGSVYRPR
jgi:hypothetical protein